MLKLLLETGSVDLNTRSNSGQTPLSLAARDGRKAVVILLLETGKVDINTRSRNGDTPLSQAAARGHNAVVRLLLSKGAEQNIAD